MTSHREACTADGGTSRDKMTVAYVLVPGL